MEGYDEDIDNEMDDAEEALSELPAEEEKPGEVEVFNGDEIAPQIRPMPYKRRGEKAPYRPLTIPERDTLFAYYEKHNGNQLAMTRDRECTFKAYSQVRYYAEIYGFKDQLIKAQQKKAEATLAGLSDAKLEAVARAVEMIRPRQVALRNSKQEVILVDGAPVFETIYPSQKEIKTAWEIIKTELGEPTFIAKSEHITPQTEEMRLAIETLAKLTEHAPQPRDNGGAVQDQREAAEDTAPVSTAVSNDSDAEPSAQ